MGPVRLLGRLAIQAMILIFLLDGIVDVTIPIATKIGRTSAEIIERLNNNVTARDWRRFSERNVPGIGAVSNQMDTPTIHVDARGRRATGQAVRGQIHGVLLGASQAVGFMVADDATLAAALERQLPDVSMDNYAGDGRTITDNMTRWLTLHDALNDTDFTILLEAGMQFSRACRVFPEPLEQPALRDLWRQFVNKTPFADPALRHAPCATREAQDAVITHTLFEMRAAIDAARRENRRLAIVLAPTLFGNHAPTGTLRKAFQPDVAETLDSVFRGLRLRLAANPIPGVYDLSDAFDTSPKNLFRDSGSHFNRQGSALLARAIIARIPAPFSPKPSNLAALPQQTHAVTPNTSNRRTRMLPEKSPLLGIQHSPASWWKG